MKKLQVLYCGWGQRWLLGTLAHSGRDVVFEYSEEALKRNIQLSPFNLLLRPAAYSGFPKHQDYLPGLIADALPDGWGRLIMDRYFSKAGRELAQISPLDRLAFIHDRAMGCLVFEPEDPLSLAPEELDLLRVAEAAQIVLSGQDTEALRQLAVLGGSPQGARPKVLAQYDVVNNAISTLPDAPGVPWLIKFQAANEHKEVCAIEALYARMAEVCELDMPATHHFDLDKNLAGFGIERFDRQAGLRVPTITLAGLLDDDFRTPTRDYRDFLRATRGLARDQREVQRAFERCVFNVVFNNRDDHSKNFSFLLDEHLEWKLAPCYDLTFSLGPHGWHQMTIMGEGVKPSRTNLLALAKDCDLKGSWASSVIDRITTRAGDFLQEAQRWSIRPVTLREIAKAIECNRAQM